MQVSLGTLLMLSHGNYALNSLERTATVPVSRITTGRSISRNIDTLRIFAHWAGSYNKSKHRNQAR